ncbi:hypothetical protein BG000_000771 [Podila horticola]|nr:hypothetical protein BG000_000771 [Podila horticola]
MSIVALAALVMSARSEIFKRDSTSVATVALCLSKYSHTFALSAAAIPCVIKSIALSQLTYIFTTANPWAPLVSSSAVATLSFPTPPITAIVNHIQIFTLTLKGTSDVTFTVPFFGDRAITDFAFMNDNVFVGLKSFPGVKFVRFTSEENADPNTYTSVVQVNLKNPSSLRLILGNLAFDIAGPSGAKIGSLNFKEVILEQGDNIVTMDISLDLTLPAGMEFMTRIGAGRGGGDPLRCGQPIAQ